MKVAVIADSHYDEHKRFAECKRLHEAIADDCDRRGVDLFIHTGDLNDSKSTPLVRLATAAWTRRMASKRPGIFIRGNHDAIDDLLLLAQLDTEYEVHVVETSAVIEIGGALIGCMAWPRKAALLAATGASDHDGSEAIAAELLRDQLRAIGDALATHDGPTMLAMHAMVQESMTSTGQPLVGCDFELTLADLSLARARAYLLGHVHMPQHWMIGKAPVIYPGSPRRTNFGEVEAKGYVVLDFDDAGNLLGWEFVELPATPMIHLNGEWSTEGLVGIAVDGDVDAVHGAEVRLRYTVPHQDRVAARRAAEELRGILIGNGAVSVQLEEQVELEQRQRAEVVWAQSTLQEKLEAYWAAKNFEPGARRSALLDKLHKIEEARRAA